MNSQIRILLFSLLLGILSSAQSANLKFSSSALSNHIAQPQISALYTDKRGLLWIGTDEGLYQFDGVNFTKFHSAENGGNWIPSGQIRGISEDAEGNLLVATANAGILIWDIHSNTFSPIKRSVSNATQIRQMLVTKNGNIWLTTTDRVVLYSERASGISAWLATDPVRNAIGRPTALLEDSAGSLFVGGSKRIIRISLSGKTLYQYDLSSLQVPGDFVVSAIEGTANGNLVFGTDTGILAILNPKNGTLLAKASVTDTSVFISKLKLYKDKMLIATDRGLYITELDLSQIQDIGYQGSKLSNNDIHSIHVDGDRVWVGTYNGLDLLSLAPFDLLNSTNGGIDNDILSFEQDAFGRVWIGTYNGLYYYDEASRSHLRFESEPNSPGLMDQRVTALSASKKRLWVGFYRRGYQAFEMVADGTYQPSITNSGNLLVTDINADDEEGLGVWIATLNKGLLRITPEKTYRYFSELSDAENGVVRILSKNNRVIVVSSKNNIYEYNRSKDAFSLLNFHLGIDKEVIGIFSLAEDKAGNLWFGTKEHGLLLWSRSDQEVNKLYLEQVSRGSDLQHSTIYGIEPDRSGNLWCSTQNGIVKLDSYGRLIRRFTTADGLQGRDFSFGASFQSREGVIYFGGANGYNRFNPDTLAVANEPSRMRLTGISFPGRKSKNIGVVDELQSVELTHQDRSVTFQFSVLDFVDPERNQFRYKLENFDIDWIESGTNNTATFTNLPAGNYNLRVQGANSAGVWNRKGLSLAVTVLPAPWLTWWAFMLYGVTLLCAAWALHRIYYSYVVERRSAELALEMFEAENRADDEMQEQLEIQDEWVNSAHLHSQTTLSLITESISIRNPQLSDDTTGSVTENSIRRITALYNLEDCLCYQVGGPLANLHKYTDELFPVLLEKSPIAPETIITINEVTTIPIPVELASPLAVIIFELLENCFQHAFEPDSPANYVHVMLAHAQSDVAPYRKLELSIHDNGVGMPTDIEHLNSECSGLALVQSIVTKLGGTLKLTSMAGTVVSVEIPQLQYA